MITKKDILRLRDAIPPRGPRGSPQNWARCIPGAAFGHAIVEYNKQHKRRFKNEAAQG